MLVPHFSIGASGGLRPQQPLPPPDAVGMLAAGAETPGSGIKMGDTNVARSRVPPGEPRLILPFLAPFYDVVRDLSYLLMRVSLGSLVLYHAFTSGKLTGKVTIASFAVTLAKRGLEPSVPFAYLVFFSETVAAVCLIVGLFTRFVAAAIAIELAVITFVVYWPNGFHFAQTPGGGAELPLLLQGSQHEGSRKNHLYCRFICRSGIRCGLHELLPTTIVLLLPFDPVLLRRLLLQTNAMHMPLVQILLPRLLLQADALHVLLVQILLPGLLLQTDALRLLPEDGLRWLRPNTALRPDKV